MCTIFKRHENIFQRHNDAFTVSEGELVLTAQRDTSAGKFIFCGSVRNGNCSACYSKKLIVIGSMIIREVFGRESSFLYKQ